MPTFSMPPSRRTFTNHREAWRIMVFSRGIVQGHDFGVPPEILTRHRKIQSGALGSVLCLRCRQRLGCTPLPGGNLGRTGPGEAGSEAEYWPDHPR